MAQNNSKCKSSFISVYFRKREFNVELKLFVKFLSIDRMKSNKYDIVIKILYDDKERGRGGG